MRKISEAIDNMASWLFLFILGGICCLYFKISNRTKVTGFSKNLRKERGIIFYSNHLTMLDPFLILTVIYYPWSLLRLSLLPYIAADGRNFATSELISQAPFFGRFLDNNFGAWLMKKMAKYSHCVLVRRNERGERKDSRVLWEMIRLLRQGKNLLIFPEGTRSRSGQIYLFQFGLAELTSIKGIKVKLVPVYISGIEKCLPIGYWRPRCGKKIKIIFGQQFNLEDLEGYSKEKRKDRIWITTQLRQKLIELSSL